MAPLTNLNLDEKGHTPKYCREQSVAQRMVGSAHFEININLFHFPSMIELSSSWLFQALFSNRLIL